MSSDRRVYYVYAIVRAGVDTREAPAGIGGAPVQALVEDQLAALVSALDAGEYAADLIEERVGDVEWLAPRAEAHDAVVSWAGNPGPVVPLHMWTLFSDEPSVREMLSGRTRELSDVLRRLDGADEYGLRVYVDATELEKTAAQRSVEVAELEKSRDASGPGQRYLIERKLERERRDAARALAGVAADSVFDALRAQSTAAARDPVPAPGVADGSAVLSAAFLVPRARLDDFRSAVTRVVREHEPQGFRFAFTGPWPPYHFASIS